MSMFKTVGCLAVVGVLLTGCLSSGGGGGGNAGNQNGGGEAPPAASISFTSLVNSLFAATSGNTEPMTINQLNITFDDQDNESAFDNLLNP